MTAGMYLGIEVISHTTNVGHYGVAVLYLVTICEVLQFILRQIISVESYPMEFVGRNSPPTNDRLDELVRELRKSSLHFIIFSD